MSEQPNTIKFDGRQRLCSTVLLHHGDYECQKKGDRNLELFQRLEEARDEKNGKSFFSLPKTDSSPSLRP